MKEIDKVFERLELENRVMRACLGFTWSAIVFGLILIAIGYIW